VGEQPERGPLYEAMYEAIREEVPILKPAFVERVTRVTTEVAAMKIGNIARNMQPQIDSALAVAWDRGYTSGHSNAMRQMSDEPDAPPTPNPYRTEGVPDGG
jgi:hypothetical protein